MPARNEKCTQSRQAEISAEFWKHYNKQVVVLTIMFQTIFGTEQLQ